LTNCKKAVIIKAVQIKTKKMENEQEKVNKTLAFILGNRGILFATAVTILLLVFGLFALFSMPTTSQYQGLIKQVETKAELMSGK